MSSCSRPPLEVADVFRLSGTQYKSAQHRHLSLAQLKVMSVVHGAARGDGRTESYVTFQNYVSSTKHHSLPCEVTPTGTVRNAEFLS